MKGVVEYDPGDEAEDILDTLEVLKVWDMLRDVFGIIYSYHMINDSF